MLLTLAAKLLRRSRVCKDVVTLATHAQRTANKRDCLILSVLAGGVERAWNRSTHWRFQLLQPTVDGLCQVYRTHGWNNPAMSGPSQSRHFPLTAFQTEFVILLQGVLHYPRPLRAEKEVLTGPHTRARSIAVQSIATARLPIIGLYERTSFKCHG